MRMCGSPSESCRWRHVRCSAAQAPIAHRLTGPFDDPMPGGRPFATAQHRRRGVEQAHARAVPGNGGNPSSFKYSLCLAVALPIAFSIATNSR